MERNDRRGQVDIVEQAEAIVNAYVERYFSYEQKVVKQCEAKKKAVGRLVAVIGILGAAAAVLLVALAMFGAWS